MKLILRYEDRVTLEECNSTDENAKAIIQLVSTEKEQEYKEIKGYGWGNRVGQIAWYMNRLGAGLGGADDTYLKIVGVDKAKNEYARLMELFNLSRLGKSNPKKFLKDYPAYAEKIFND